MPRLLFVHGSAIKAVTPLPGLATCRGQERRFAAISLRGENGRITSSGTFCGRFPKRFSPGIIQYRAAPLGSSPHCGLEPRGAARYWVIPRSEAPGEPTGRLRPSLAARAFRDPRRKWDKFGESYYILRGFLQFSFINHEFTVINFGVFILYL